MKRLFAVLAALVLAWLVAMPFLVGGQEKKRDEFAGDRIGGEAGAFAFDSKRAMGYLQAICDLGPRQSGTAAMRKQQELIRKHFEDLGCTVRAQKFEARQKSVKEPVSMTNLIVSFHPERNRRVIICSHYDTRPIADQEPDPRDWRKPFVSANDGGSGVALLMELAHQMKDLPTKVGVDFVFFDGEEYIFKTSGPDRDEYFIGSKYFAQTWKKDREHCDYAGAVLLDMIAGKGASFPAEVNSFKHSEDLVRELWNIAEKLNCNAFVKEIKHEVQDDHLQLQYVGIPAVDIIDFDYRHWHRLADTPTSCHPAGMEQVARVLTVWLQRVK
jgi:hypothetical protein